MTLLGERLHLWRRHCNKNGSNFSQFPVFVFPPLNGPVTCFGQKKAVKWCSRSKPRQQGGHAFWLSLGDLLWTQAQAGLLEGERPHAASRRPGHVQLTSSYSQVHDRIQLHPELPGQFADSRAKVNGHYCEPQSFGRMCYTTTVTDTKSFKETWF